MSDLEGRLVRELDGIAGAETGPRIDLAGVRRVARRERRRRRGLLAGVVVVVAGGVGLVGSLDGGSVPTASTPADLPTGAELALPWADATGTVHLPGGDTVAVEGLVTILHRGPTTLVGSGQENFGDWSIVVDAVSGPRLVPLVSGLLGAPVIALDGSHVAWVQEIGRTDGTIRWRITDRDMTTGTEQKTVLQRPLSSQRDAGFGAVGVDDVGRVLVERASAAGVELVTWSPGSAPVAEVDAPVGQARVLLPGGRLVSYRQTGEARLRSSDPGAGAANDETLFGTPPLALNDDATTYVARVDGEQAFVRPGARSRGMTVLEPLGLPDDRDWGVVGWESPTVAVLVRAGGNDRGWTDLVRCDARASRGGACERVPDEDVAVLPTS